MSELLVYGTLDEIISALDDGVETIRTEINRLRALNAELLDVLEHIASYEEAGAFYWMKQEARAVIAKAKDEL